ncbi:Integrase catalytic domain-containing protein [Citrus sinensis]|uniref:Integrase catalytic domain-containing protein n=1 Tax=Citrus sinensis TaxID=2711 RepID=A0ACB8JEF4_CITSI|nr:Integrase catalytic domain-containing protein [Citrus sinensis]
MGTSKFEVEKFIGENDFHLWWLNIRALLVHQGLEETLGDPRSEKKPSKLSDDEMRDALDKAHSTLILSLGDGVLREVGDQTTTAGLWKKLEDLYTKKSLTKRLCTKKSLYTLQMEERSSLATYIDSFNRIILDLEDINVSLEDEDKAIILLSSLPPSYEHFVNTLLYGRQSISMADVKDSLSSKEVTKRAETKAGEGLMARGRPEKRNYNKGKKRDKSKSKNKNLKCFHCHKEGHFKRDYPDRKNKGKEGHGKNGDAAVASEDEGYDSAGVLLASKTQTNSKWILDSGCSYHMYPDQNLFTTYNAFNGGEVLMGNNTMCKVVGLGTIRFKMFDGIIRELREVRHIPDLKKNLISPGTLDQVGCSIKVEYGVMKVVRGSIVIMKWNKQNGLYVLQGTAVTGDVSILASLGLDKTLIWHLRLGHMSEKGLKILEKQGVLGDDKLGSQEFCETVSLGGAKYFLSFIDDYSRMVWVYVLKGKDEVFERFKQWKALVETQSGRKIKRLRTDNGLEFCNKQFDDFCKLNGIARYKTVSYTPQQNGLAERMNRTLMDKVRCLLIHSKLPQTLWAETLMTSWYPEGVKGYKLWCTEIRPPKCIVSRDVVFNESEMLMKRHKKDLAKPEGGLDSQGQHLKVELKGKSALDYHDEAEDMEREETEDISEISGTHTDIQDYQLARDRQRRVIKTPKSMHLEQMDVKTTFLHGELEEQIIMSQPEGFEDQSKVQTPLPAHFRLSEQQCPIADADKSEMMKIPYASAVGCLMYAMVLTRPDIAHAVSVVSRYMSNLGKEHWKAIRWILRYLRGTSRHGLIHGGQRRDDSLIVGYVDADYTRDLDRRRSLIGYLFTFNNCTINWKSQLYSVVALSTTKAEYTAAAEAIKEAIWLKGMLKELGVNQRWWERRVAGHESFKLKVENVKEDGVEITANSLHPGIVLTNIFREGGFFNAILGFVGKYLLKNVQQGAATTCYVALHPQVKGKSGLYFSECNIAQQGWHAADTVLARKLWDFSLDLVKKCFQNS